MVMAALDRASLLPPATLTTTAAARMLQPLLDCRVYSLLHSI